MGGDNNQNKNANEITLQDFDDLYSSINLNTSQSDKCVLRDKIQFTINSWNKRTYEISDHQETLNRKRDNNVKLLLSFLSQLQERGNLSERQIEIAETMYENARKHYLKSSDR